MEVPRLPLHNLQVAELLTIGQPNLSRLYMCDLMTLYYHPRATLEQSHQRLPSRPDLHL
jgi:hypothetical protein